MLRRYTNITRLVRRYRLKNTNGPVVLTFAADPSMRGMRLRRG